MRLEFNSKKVSDISYINYCKLVFKLIKTEINNNLNELKYQVRESDIINSGLIKWNGTPPKHLNFSKYIKNCLELVNENGTLVIRLNDTKLIQNSSTKVSILIRLLEYGNEKIQPYPFIRLILLKYENLYNYSNSKGGRR